MSIQENMIVVDHLNKNFGTVHAVNDLSFRVRKGELFAFLGVNGAGKSTTISMICGQLAMDSGGILVNGQDVKSEGHKMKEWIGVVFQDSALDKPLTARENLKSRADFTESPERPLKSAFRNSSLSSIFRSLLIVR